MGQWAWWGGRRVMTEAWAARVVSAAVMVVVSVVLALTWMVSVCVCVCLSMYVCLYVCRKGGGGRKEGRR